MTQCRERILLFASAVGLAFSAAAQSTPPAASQEHLSQRADNQWLVNFNDTDISAVIQQIGKVTGENYVIGNNITGKISVVSQTPLKKNEVEELLRSVLYVNGFSIVPSGNILMIRPNEDAKKNKIAIDTKGKISGEAFVARVLSVKYALLPDLLQAVQPLVSDFAVVKALPDSNALLVVDKADNVQKIAQLISELDYPETDSMQTVRLTKAWVGNVMPLLEKLAPRELGASGNRALSPIRLVGDEQNNTIILKGDKDARTRIAAMIAELDKVEDDTDAIQVISLHNADATKTADILKEMFASSSTTTSSASPAGTSASAPPSVSSTTAPEVLIKANPMTNAILVHATPAIVEQIRRALAQLDVQRPQVLIEAAIVEINDSLLDELGIQFGAGDAGFTSGLVATSLGTTNNITLNNYLTQAGRTNSNLISGGLTAAIGSNKFGVLVKALASDTRANLLSTPSITTVANEEATILVGQNVPFLTGSYAQATTNSGNVNPFNTIQRQDIGVSLKVTPQINEGGRLTMKIEQEVSSISPTAVAGAADIVTNKRDIHTTVMANNGQTVVLGGLISNDKTIANNKVPILGDIPILGTLFQSNSITHAKNNLLVFLRPSILISDENVSGTNLRKYNGIWELRLGEDAKKMPLTPENVTPEMEKNYDGKFIQHEDYSALPWLKDKPEDSQ